MLTSAGIWAQSSNPVSTFCLYLMWNRRPTTRTHRAGTTVLQARIPSGDFVDMMKVLVPTKAKTQTVWLEKLYAV